MWRQASLPAVEGGILPPGKTVHLSKRSHFTMTFPMATQFRRAGSPGSTSAKMADATIFRQALKWRSAGWNLEAIQLVCRLRNSALNGVVASILEAACYLMSVSDIRHPPRIRMQHQSQRR